MSASDLTRLREHLTDAGALFECFTARGGITTEHWTYEDGVVVSIRLLPGEPKPLDSR